MLLRFDPNTPSLVAGPTGGLTVIAAAASNSANGYHVVSLDWGDVDWQHQFTGPRGTQGARASLGSVQNRTVTIKLRVFGTTKDAMLTQRSALVEALDDMRRFGGQILWQSGQQTYRQFFQVLTCTWKGQEWTNKEESSFYTDFTMQFTCAPYATGDPMDTLDGFDTNTYATDYTKDAGGGTLSVSSGVLVPSDLTLKRVRHTLKGYTYGDVQVTLKVTTGAAVAGGIWGVTGRYDTTNLDTGLVAEFVAGTNVIRVGKYVAGAFTSLATAAATPAINTTYWVRLRVEGNLVTAEVFTTTAPTPMGTPTASAAYAMTTAEAAQFAAGHAGWRITPAATTERYDDLEIKPYTYRAVNLPEQIRLGGQIPGDLPAIADIEITPLGGPATPIWGAASWSERPLVTNECWHGDFEDATLSPATVPSGWSVAAVGGVTGAATSINRDTTAARCKYGAANAVVVCPATANTGATFQLFQRFKKGRWYAAFAWKSSAAGVTLTRYRLGVSGDIASSTASALTTTPTLDSVIWTPTADRDSAYFCAEITAATATTFNIDGVCIVEVPAFALGAAIASAGAPTMTLQNIPPETPFLRPDGTLAAPILALIDTELVRITSITPGSLVVPIDRGMENTTAATHTLGAPIIIVPAFRSQLEGKGAQASFGVIEAESYTPALSTATSGSLTVTADADCRGGQRLAWNPAGVGTATVTWMIDPHSLVPDDYTIGELDVEVLARVRMGASANTPKITLSCLPEGGATSGAERFTREWGSAGISLYGNGAAAVYRPERLGTLPMIVDRSNPLRWRLKAVLSLAAAGNLDLDHFQLNVIRNRVSTVTGKANDTASASPVVAALVPYNASWTTTSTMTVALKSDGTASIAIPGGYANPHHGLGRVIEVPDADCDLIVKLSNLIPNDPTVDTTTEMSAGAPSWPATVHAAVTPRYGFARGI